MSFIRSFNKGLLWGALAGGLIMAVYIVGDLSSPCPPCDQAVVDTVEVYKSYIQWPETWPDDWLERTFYIDAVFNDTVYTDSMIYVIETKRRQLYKIYLRTDYYADGGMGEFARYAWHPIYADTTCYRIKAR